MSAVPPAPAREPAAPGPAPAAAMPAAVADLVPADVGPAVLPPRPSRLRRAAARHPFVVDVLVAVAVQLVGLPATIHLGNGPWLWVLDLALVLPLIWRRRAPFVVFTIQAVVAAVQWVVGFRLGADIALLVSLYTVAAYRPRRWAVAAAAVVEVGVVLAAVRFSPARGLVASLVFLTGLAAAAFFIGTSVQNRRAYLGALVDRAAWLERERDQQARLAAIAERARIAREMHDIVAHSLTVVVTLAEAAAVNVDSDPPAARGTMLQVATTGRTALSEMRRLLGVLRGDQPGLPGGDPLAPAPGLDRIDDLVASARAAGLPVRLTVGGRPRAVPSTFDATAYRVVQESLTNALRHALEPTRVEVTLRWEQAALALSVADDGRTGRAPATVVPGGHGLAGMRQRLALFGGTLTTGPRPGGGWTVDAVLPYPGDS